MNLELFSLAGRTALVTGASRGIGFAIARQFALAGARVLLVSENAEECSAAADALVGEGLEAVGFTVDLLDRLATEQLAETVLEQYGVVDVLVCNAGIAPHSGPIATATQSEWDLTMTLNLQSPFWLSSKLMPRMAEHGGGSVIFMSSLSALRGNKAIGLYSLSKAALAELARDLAVEWGPQNVRANAIAPGVIDTQFSTPILGDPAIRAKRLAMTPLRRAGTPDEVAGVALLLASPAGGFITGQTIVVDGGTLITDGN